MSWWKDITGQTAADNAASAQNDAANKGIEEMRAQFEQSQENMQSYMDTGSNALTQQGDLSGANGAAAQAAARAAISESEGFQATLAQGEKSLLQNASATGGVRGGNTAGALAQYAPQLLNSAVDQQYSQLGSLSNMGLNATSQVNAEGAQLSGNIADAYTNIGNTNAQNELAGYSLQKNFLSSAYNMNKDAINSSIDLIGAIF